MDARKVEHAFAILDDAWSRFAPQHVFAFFSGGYDSLVATAVTMEWAEARQIAGPTALHINTRTGIPETRQFVFDTCAAQGWPLREYVTPERYEVLVLERGFPGPAMHAKMYDRLKGRCVAQLMRDYNPPNGGFLLFSTGIRRQESQRRMGYSDPIDVRGKQVWVNPCLEWSKDDVLDYKAARGLPSNEVVDLLHRSGECNCGSFGNQAELEEMRLWYPRTAARVDEIAEQVHACGFPWNWGESPPRWWKHARNGQMLMMEPDADAVFMPLCVGCEGRNGQHISAQTAECIVNEGAFKERTGIWAISNISARAIAKSALCDDPLVQGDTYHRRIVQAAQALANSTYIDYVYHTQYASGATVWLSPDRERSVLVSSDSSIGE